jgi:hypothetical protein
MLAAAAVAVLALARIGAAQENPWHNYQNPYDVDASGRISQRDLLLVINQLQRIHSEEPIPLAAAEGTTYFWDTSDNGRITQQDALIVINRLMVTPEPSSLLIGSVAAAAFAALCWRQRRRSARPS